MITYLAGSVDEVASVLMSDKLRALWDPSIKKIEKVG